MERKPDAGLGVCRGGSAQGRPRGKSDGEAILRHGICVTAWHLRLAAIGHCTASATIAQTASVGTWGQRTKKAKEATQPHADLTPLSRHVQNTRRHACRRIWKARVSSSCSPCQYAVGVVRPEFGARVGLGRGRRAGEQEAQAWGRCARRRQRGDARGRVCRGHRVATEGRRAQEGASCPGEESQEGGWQRQSRAAARLGRNVCPHAADAQRDRRAGRHHGLRESGRRAKKPARSEVPDFGRSHALQPNQGHRNERSHQRHARPPARSTSACMSAWTERATADCDRASISNPCWPSKAPP
jgi:hypothetical protein